MADEPRIRHPMKELRLRWSRGMSGDNGEERNGGLWHPDNLENRSTLQTVMDAGNGTYGEGTHWIEERDA